LGISILTDVIYRRFTQNQTGQIEGLPNDIEESLFTLMIEGLNSNNDELRRSILSALQSMYLWKTFAHGQVRYELEKQKTGRFISLPNPICFDHLS
jgi:hypothetical protein